MWDIVRLIAQDIVLIGWAVCILVLLLLLLLWLRISYNRMQTGKMLKNSIQSIIQILINPLVTLVAVKKFLTTDDSEQEEETSNKKWSPRKKTKTKPRNNK